jgi:hypothetical protein
LAPPQRNLRYKRRNHGSKTVQNYGFRKKYARYVKIWKKWKNNVKVKIARFEYLMMSKAAKTREGCWQKFNMHIE